ncbi:unnamed protein product [Mortierella alpina]
MDETRSDSEVQGLYTWEHGEEGENAVVSSSIFFSWFFPSFSSRILSSRSPLVSSRLHSSLLFLSLFASHSLFLLFAFLYRHLCIPFVLDFRNPSDSPTIP